VRRIAGLLAGLAFAACSLAFQGVGEVRVAALPPEARATLELVRKGGPFPYQKDGSVFGNREGLLPKRPRGHYREYTVKTPGRRDRGARRIVAGHAAGGVLLAGEVYYTEDHYRSFRRILE
jgi:ribonuclease T1